jgi:D-glycero-alpha-D-manno-heptose-7-phosphate kinase
MRIKATTPTRIDLAGGTLDLYPLYLFEEGGLTVNCAINMYCLVTLEPRNDKQIRLTSIDLNIHEQFANIDSMSTTGPLEIVARAIKFFRPNVGLNVTTENRVVKGSGLGASSSLLIATLAALNELMNSVYSSDELIDLAADLEAQCIRIPTGKQDYFAAVFGGVNALWFEVGGNQREDLLNNDGDGITEIENRIILSFTGAPRFSGATNWSMIKNYIDNNPDTLAGMKQIKETAIAMRECILNRNWNEFASVVNREWLNRRTLAKGVTNEQVEAVMHAARSAGALANKLCGAGGGGCMITCVEPQHRSRVETALNSAGAQVLPFKIVKDGVKVERLQ